jgi:putative hydrolase of the HAD superfamily
VKKNGTAAMSRLHVVFDLDDTLYPERQFAACGFRACARWAKAEFGLDGIDADMMRLLRAGHLGKLFALVLEERLPGAHTSEHVQSLIGAYRAADAELQLFDDAAWALERYAAMGPLGLITDGTHAMQLKKVRALALEPVFREIVYTDLLGENRAYAKPHARSFELIEAALGPEGDRFVYVGDNPIKDFVAPNARGWMTVQVVREDGIHDVTRVADGGKPQFQLTSLRELPRVLGV